MIIQIEHETKNGALINLQADPYTSSYTDERGRNCIEVIAIEWSYATGGACSKTINKFLTDEYEEQLIEELEDER